MDENISGFQSLGEIKPLLNGLDKVELRDIDIDELNEEEYEDYKAIHNTSTNRLVKISRPRARIFQHQEVMEKCVDTMVALNLKGQAHLRNDRNKVVMDVILDQRTIGTEQIRYGFRIVSDYNKAGGVSIELFAFREICANGMIMGKIAKSIFRAETLAALESDMKEAINYVVARNDKFDKYISDAMKDSLEWDYATKLIAIALHSKQHARSVKRLLEENIKEGKVSRWDIYNSFTNYATHGELITDHLADRLQRNAQKILITPKELYEKVE